MKDTFDFNRFGKYFLYDLGNAWQKCWLSAILISAIIPVVTYAFSMILPPGNDELSLTLNRIYSIYSIAIWAFLIELLLPEKIYGYVTGKKTGGHFLLIPASNLEKTVSMVIISGIAIPVFTGLIFIACNGLLSLLPFNDTSFFDSFATISEAVGFDFSALTGIGVLGFFYSMLFFTLGAIFFKKSKAAKTLLISFALTVTISILTVIKMTSSGASDISTESLTSKSYISYSIMAALTILGIWFRIKTLKH